MKKYRQNISLNAGVKLGCQDSLQQKISGKKLEKTRLVVWWINVTKTDKLNEYPECLVVTSIYKHQILHCPVCQYNMVIGVLYK